MVQSLRAAFYRGGTSKAVVFNSKDLPTDQALRDRIFLHVLGSPDPNGRQLDGLGGGLSSLSKVVIVGPSTHPDADVDYTFVQIAVRAPVADYGSTCGNMSSCVGPFAVREGFVTPTDETCQVRIHNTNTGQIYQAEFAVKDGAALEDGNFEIPGVSGSGAPIRLDFLNPGGAVTGALLPTGHEVDNIITGSGERFEVSLIDAANPVVFVRARDIGCTGHEAPETLDNNAELMHRMDEIRRAGGVAMGMATCAEEIPLSNPKVAMVAHPREFTSLDGRCNSADSHDIAVRLISMGNFHKAITLSGGMCVAVACKLEGSLPAQIGGDAKTIRVGNPSGVLPVDAEVEAIGPTQSARSATTFRTQRCIMSGAVHYPDDLLRKEIDTP
ncbi:hypothetical protein SAMN04488118_102500 [Epibacterium ulvae]|uniref:PrpF family protein n=1 Tax=Epibacterium ulvae TaxID=1156985 RepID=A0A1G5Q3F8_9RHOB|nr:PrpF domain-containing protein [Epibacterium ulvae]SCZ55931.1 hypothetical protein SAMN04488118_102500 [Epibacterium ulvae]